MTDCRLTSYDTVREIVPRAATGAARESLCTGSPHDPFDENLLHGHLRTAAVPERNKAGCEFVTWASRFRIRQMSNRGARSRSTSRVWQLRTGLTIARGRRRRREEQVMGRRVGPKGIETSGFVNQWEPPSYSVDERGKVIGGYEPPLVHNWGRWGDDDQRGTANLIGPEQVVKAARLIEKGDIFSLSLALGPDAPRAPHRNPPSHFVTISGSDLVIGHPTLDAFHLQYTDDAIVLTLQDSTQWDGLAHCAYQDTMYNGFWAGNVTADGGAKILGIEQQIESFTGRGVLVDLPRHLGVDALAPRYVISTDLLDAAAAAQNLTFEPGDMLLYRTGHQTRWDGKAMTAEQKVEWFVDSPRLEPTAVQWLRDHDFAALCTDCTSPDGVPCSADFAKMGPYDTSQPIHVGGLVGLGLAIGELFYLEELAEACGEDGKYAFFMCAPPLNIPGAVGSPLTGIAIK
jgi:kynurenine formamidase